MPKEMRFDITTLTDSDYEDALIKILKNKAKQVSFFGVKPKSITVSIWSLNLEGVDFEAIKSDVKLIKLIEEDFNVKKVNKVKYYTELKAKLDYCLFDVKAYLKLCEHIDEFSYCGATSELEVFKKRYLSSNGYTKSKYRARSQEYSKIKCN